MMTTDDLFKKWVDHRKKAGKSEKEIGEEFAGVIRLSALEAFTEALTALTKEDRKVIEDIEDDDEAEKKLAELYEQRTGKTFDSVIDRVQREFLEKSLEASEE